MLVSRGNGPPKKVSRQTIGRHDLGNYYKKLCHPTRHGADKTQIPLLKTSPDGGLNWHPDSKF
ncbi:MAG TPA: hypothetical protein VFF11_09750 [Candidatus Binatia bacterium]|nr:hypothetical protein [Candidatus Binatia bacterium]